MPRTLAVNRVLVRDFGTSIAYNGTSTNIAATATTGINSGVFSIACWVKLNPSASGPRAIMAGDTVNGPKALQIKADGFMELDKQNQVNIATSTTAVSNYVWTHVGLSYDASGNYAFYVNGVAAGSGTNLQTFVSTTNYWVGTINGSPSWINGLLDEYHLYSRVLTAAEFLNLYIGIEPATTNLQIWWKFDEGSGSSATDSSGNANTGTITNGSYSTDVVSKPRTLASNRASVYPLGTSLLFDGTSAAVSCGTADPGNTFTVGAWIKWGGTTSGFQTILAKRDSFTASTMMWQFYLQNTTGEVRMISNAGSAAVTGYIPPVGTWTHLAWIRSGTTGPTNLIAINGYIVNQATGTLNNGTGTSALLTIGANQATPQEFFNGRIDEAFICSAALTEAQLQDVIHKRYAAVPNQFALWKFDEGSGSTAIDSAGANTGTITAATYSTDIPFSSRTLAV